MGTFLAIVTAIPTTPATPGNSVDFTWLFLKMLLVLGIVSVLAVLILKYAVPHIGFIRRFHQSRIFVVHAKQSLEPRKSLYLVGVGKRYLVIGVSDHAIHLVSELSEEEARNMGYT